MLKLKKTGHSELTLFFSGSRYSNADIFSRSPTPTFRDPQYAGNQLVGPRRFFRPNTATVPKLADHFLQVGTRVKKFWEFDGRNDAPT